MTAHGDARRGRRPADLIQSLQRGLRVLEFVSAAPCPVTVKAVAEALQLHPSTTHHLVNTLLYEGYLDRDRDRRLIPGRAACPQPAPAGWAGDRLVAVRRALGRAAYAVDDVALLTTLDGSEAVVAALEAVPGATNATAYPIGSRHLLHRSAAGRAMLATHDDAAGLLDALRCEAGRQGRGIDEACVATELERIRRRGLGFAAAEREACVAAPVLDACGRPLGAVALLTTPRRLRGDLDRFAATAKRTAAVISRLVTGLQGSGELPPGPSVLAPLTTAGARSPGA
ncbi:MAG: IclR family transcriptional regulator, acetate operon repressor [Solirubrobacteraceae bacterium]|nr:IclR family transcriptional regulator, acetate operon repressor [Solirubrobacteraceae bacterium]